MADKGLGAQGAQEAGISLWLCPTPPSQAPSGAATRWSPRLLFRGSQGQLGVHAAGAGQGAGFRGPGSYRVASAKAKVTPSHSRRVTQARYDPSNPDSLLVGLSTLYWPYRPTSPGQFYPETLSPGHIHVMEPARESGCAQLLSRTALHCPGRTALPLLLPQGTHECRARGIPEPRNMPQATGDLDGIVHLPPSSIPGRRVSRHSGRLGPWSGVHGAAMLCLRPPNVQEPGPKMGTRRLSLPGPPRISRKWE